MKQQNNIFILNTNTEMKNFIKDNLDLLFFRTPDARRVPWVILSIVIWLMIISTLKLNKGYEDTKHTD